MKRILILLVALLILVPAALAEGNRLLELDDADYIERIIAGGDTLYIFTGDRLYTWQEGDEAPTAWEAGEIVLPNAGGGEDYVSLYEFRLYADEAGLHGVRVGYDEDYMPASLRLCDLTLADGAIQVSQTAELPLPDALRDDAYPSAACVREGLLYLLCEGESGCTLSLIDPEDPKRARMTALNSWDCTLMPAKDGVLMAWYDYTSSDSERSRVVSRVLDDGSLEDLCRLPAEAEGIAADAETGALYAVISGRVRPVDTATGEAGEPIGALPVSPRYGAVLGHSYAASMGGEVAVLDVGGRLDESAVLSITCSYSDDWLNKAVIAYSVEHPELAPVMGNQYASVLDDMMTQSPDTDIYIISGWDGATYEALLNRGYMAPLEGSEALNALAERIYPNLMKKLTHDGALVALPVSLYGDGMGLSRSLLEKLGIDADAIPGDWPGFLDFMEDELKPRLSQLGEKDRFAYDGMNAQDFTYFLRQRMLDDFLQASSAAGMIPDYEDPRLAAALERLDGIDFTEYGLPDKAEGDENMGYGWSSDTHYLVQFNASYLFGDMMTDNLPLPLGFGDDLPGVLSVQLTAAFVNPYAAHRDEAVAFLEALSRRMPDELMYALCPGLTEPVKRPEADRELAWYEQALEQMQKNVESAEPSEKQLLQEDLDDFLAEYEDFKQNGCWLISAEKLAWYRANAERLVVATPSWFDKDTSGEAWQLMDQYNAGQLSAREFLAAVNRKARMMAMEEG